MFLKAEMVDSERLSCFQFCFGFFSFLFVYYHYFNIRAICLDARLNPNLTISDIVFPKYWNVKP